MRETGPDGFQRKVIRELEKLLPGVIILKNDPEYIQGIPDLLFLFNDRWGALEVKRSSSASVRPNQAYYVDLMDSMSFASFIYPENKEEVFDEIQRSFKA